DNAFCLLLAHAVFTLRGGDFAIGGGVYRRLLFAVRAKNLPAVRTEIECSIPPFIYKDHEKENDEDEHAEVSIPAEFRERDRPTDDEHGLYIKDDEEHGDQIELC